MSLSTVEKTQVATLVNGVVGNLTTTLREFASAVQGGQDTAAIITPALVATATAIRECGLTLTLLAGQNASAGMLDPKPPTRVAALTSAWFHLDRVRMFANQAVVALRAAIGTNTVRARMITLPAAVNAVARVDRTLPYDDPRPQVDPRFDARTMTGPHGNYDFASWSVWRWGWYWLDTMDVVFPAYLQMPPVVGADFIHKSGNLLDLSIRGIARFLGVNTTQLEIDNQAKLDALAAGPFGSAFWQILGYGQVLTDFNAPSQTTAPGTFQDLMDDLASVVAEPWRTALKKWADSWKRMDKAMWEALLTFPGADLINEPAGAAAALPSQNVTLELVAVHTIDGTTTVTATLTNGRGDVVDIKRLDIPDILKTVVTAPESFQTEIAGRAETYQRVTGGVVA